MTEKNRSWDAGRFIQTLAYFEAIPFASWLQRLLQGRINHNENRHAGGKSVGADEKLLFDFTNPKDDLKNTWGAVDDVVMGGVSESDIRLVDGLALFAGNVSTQNSGGFASVRTRNFDPPFNLAGCEGLELRVKGDGKRYKFLVRTETKWDGTAYSYSFDTASNSWMSVRIPFAEMVPVFRAKSLKDAASIDSSNIRSFQLMLSKFEYDGELNPNFEPGGFALQVESIKVYGGTTLPH